MTSDECAHEHLHARLRGPRRQHDAGVHHARGGRRTRQGTQHLPGKQSCDVITAKCAENFLTPCVVFSGRLWLKLVARFRFSLQNHHVNLLHIESRPSKQNKQDYAFFVSCDNTKGGLKDAIEELKAKVKDLRVLSRDAQFMDNNDDAGARASESRIVLTYEPDSQW